MTDLRFVDLDTSSSGNYRPISNLTILSKILEKLIPKQLTYHLSCNILLLLVNLPAYRSGRSTEASLQRVFFDLAAAMDKNHFKGAPWSSGTILDEQPKGCGFESDPSHCVATLSKC